MHPIFWEIEHFAKIQKNGVRKLRKHKKTNMTTKSNQVIHQFMFKKGNKAEQKISWRKKIRKKTT